MSIMDRNRALDILKCCFPKADSVKIVHNTLADGDSHFTSNVSHLTVEYEQEGKRQQKHLVMKSAPCDELFKHFDNTLHYFSREISFYQVVLPKITSYVGKNLAPAYLHTTESKILILEDMTAVGYDSGEKHPLLDFHQMKDVLKAYASFHAASHKLHEEDPHLLESLFSTHIPVIELRRNMINNCGPVLLELLKRKNETSLVPRVRGALSYLKKDDDQIRALINQSKFKFVALNHGDSCKENLMLKCGSNGQVEDVQFIDFQSSLWSSPLLDIFFLFTTSVSIDVIEAHYDDLVDGYLHELNKKLQKLNCSSSYQRADLDKDFKILRFFLLGCVLWSCLFFSPIDHEQKVAIFSKSQVDVGHIYDLCLKDDTFVHVIYGWLKFCEKYKVFESYKI